MRRTVVQQTKRHSCEGDKEKQKLTCVSHAGAYYRCSMELKNDPEILTHIIDLVRP